MMRNSVLIAVLVIGSIGCSDGLFVSPDGSSPPALDIAYSLASGLSADAADAFDAADRARIRVSGPGVALDTVVVFEPAVETRVALELGSAQDGAAYQVDVELRRGTDPLFHGETRVTMHGGQKTEVVVPLKPLAADLLLPESVPIMQVIGDTVLLSAIAVFSTGDTIPGAIVTWSSSNEAVATVDAAGRVVIHADGSTVITARSGSVTRSVTITVLETPARLVRVCATGTGRTFAAVAMAVDSVASGGTIRFCSGAYVADGLVIGKPVTLEAESGATVLVRPDTASIALHLQHATGTTTVRGIDFISGSIAAVFGSNYSDVVIENSTVQNVNSARGIHFVGNADAGSVTVRDVEVTGGQTGVFFHGPAQFHVVDSRFGGQIFTNIQYQTGAGGSILRNTIQECGQGGCIRARFASDLVIADNVMQTTARVDVFQNGVQLGLVADGENVRVERNSVIGLGTIADPANRSTYPIRDTGILVMSTNNTVGSARLTGNTVRGAATGIAASVLVNNGGIAARVSGSDNKVSETQTAVASVSGGTFDLHRSDFTGYQAAIFSSTVLESGSLTCNWWGSSSGPQNAGNIDPAVYTPFATVPISGTSVTCPPTGAASLSGTVVNASTGEPVAGTQVELRQSGVPVQGTITSDSGTFALTQLDGGSYSVHITASGFTDFTTDIVIGSTESVTRTFELDRETFAGGLIQNGDFETGDLSGWQVFDAGSGAFTTFSGDTTPISGFTVLPPPEGSVAALTDQTGPGTHILYQDVTIPETGVTTLSFTIWIVNRSAGYVIRSPIDHVGDPNQHMRVDIVDPAADIQSDAALALIFLTSPGDPLSIGYTTITADVSAFAGQTVRLRFAEVDNQGNFNAGVDAVALINAAQAVGSSLVLPQRSALPHSSDLRVMNYGRQ